MEPLPWQRTLSPCWQLITSCLRHPCLHAVLALSACLSLPAKVLPILPPGPLARWHCSQSWHPPDCHPQAECLLLIPKVSHLLCHYRRPNPPTAALPSLHYFSSIHCMRHGTWFNALAATCQISLLLSMQEPRGPPTPDSGAPRAEASLKQTHLLRQALKVQLGTLQRAQSSAATTPRSVKPSPRDPTAWSPRLAPIVGATAVPHRERSGLHREVVGSGQALQTGLQLAPESSGVSRAAGERSVASARTVGGTGGQTAALQSSLSEHCLVPEGEHCCNWGGASAVPVHVVNGSVWCLWTILAPETHCVALRGCCSACCIGPAKPVPKCPQGGGACLQRGRWWQNCCMPRRQQTLQPAAAGQHPSPWRPSLCSTWGASMAPSQGSTSGCSWPQLCGSTAATLQWLPLALPAGSWLRRRLRRRRQGHRCGHRGTTTRRQATAALPSGLD